MGRVRSLMVIGYWLFVNGYSLLVIEFVRPLADYSLLVCWSIGV